MDEKQRIHGERYPVDEDFLAALGANAAGVGHRARFRPAGDAGDRRATHRAGDMDAGGRAVNLKRKQRCRHSEQPRNICDHGLCAARAARRSGRGRRALRGGAAAGFGRTDRPQRSATIRSRASSFPMRPNSTRGRRSCADPIGDDAHSPVEGIVHRYPDRVLLKLTPVCAVYCRFCFRREMVGPGKAKALSAAALARALDYIRSRPEIWEVILTGGDPLVLSARRLRAVMKRLGGHRPRQGRAHPHPRAGRRAGAHDGGAGAGAQGQRQADLCGAARQSCARTDAGSARGLRAAGRRRHSAARRSRCCSPASTTRRRRWAN